MVKSKKKGFTIVELLIVIAILGILAVVYLPRFAGATDEAKKAADRSSAAAIANACEVFNALYEDDVTPKLLCEKKLIDEKLLIPQYDPKTNKSYTVSNIGGVISVYYSTNDKGDAWGTEKGNLLYPTSTDKPADKENTPSGS